MNEERRESLSRLHRKLETDIADIEGWLADFEGQLERFKPKIKYMESIPQPRRDFHSTIQTPAYIDYQDYLKEKKRLERNIQNFKDILEEKYAEKKQVEEKMKEIEITDPNTIQSANLIRMASQRRNQEEYSKTPRISVHPLHRLRAHGPHFYEQFMKNIEGRADVPGALHRKGVTLKERYPVGGKTRKRYRTRGTKKKKYI
jgi:hypothetical protein